MKLEGYECEHPTVAGKPCAICAEHFAHRCEAARVATEPAPRKDNMSPAAKIFHELWLAAERELEQQGINGLTTKEILDELLRRLNYDGADADSLTIGEIRRAV